MANAARAKSKFKAAVAKAKKLYKTGRYKTFADAVKAAYGKVGSAKASTRQTGRSVAKRDKKRKAKAPGKRRSAAGNVYYERRKNRSDKPQSLSGMVGAAKKMIADKIGACEVGKFKATTMKVKRIYAKRIGELKKQYNKLT